MRISDWSSDVCSSDLSAGPARRGRAQRDSLEPAAGEPLQIPWLRQGSATERGAVTWIDGRAPEPDQRLERSKSCDGAVSDWANHPAAKAHARPIGTRLQYSEFVRRSPGNDEIGRAACRERGGEEGKK